MRLKETLRFVVCVVSLLFAPAALAQDQEKIPQRPASEVMLPCDGACTTIIPAVAIEKAQLRFPERLATRLGEAVVEGFVSADYSIGEDGRVRDIQILELLGPKEFADSVKRTMSNWIYKPASENGKPVATRSGVHATFRQPGYAVTRRSVVAAYGTATELFKQGKLDEAEAVLTEVQKPNNLNFYERGMIANLAAAIALQKKDYLKVRHILRLAPAFVGGGLSNSVIHSLWQRRILASLYMGDIGDAVRSMARLRETVSFNSADPILRTLEQSRAKIETLPVVLSPGIIPSTEEGDGFNFVLFRRKFSIVNINGSLSHYTLSCRERFSESPISDKVEWSIPVSLSDCSILVYGRPGTTFDIVQFKD